MKKFLPIILTALMLLCSCEKESNFLSWQDDSGIAFTVEGVGVMKSELDYYFSGERNLDEDTPARELFEKRVLPDILFARAAVMIAAENGIKLTDDEQKGIDAAIEEMKSSTEKQFESEKDEALARHVLEGTQITSKLFEWYHDEKTGPAKASDDNVRAAIAGDDFIRFRSIAVINNEGDDVNENIALAERIRARIAAGEDFELVARECSEDPAIEEQSSCYYNVFRYEVLPQIEDAAFALPIGALSDVIEVNDTYRGYNIIERLPIDYEWIDEHFETLRANYVSYVFYRDVYARADALTVEGTDGLYR